MDKFVIDRLDTLITHGNVQEALKLIHIDESWCWNFSASLKIKQFFEKQASSGHTSIFQLILNWNSDIPSNTWVFF